jgi:hypothetical protein
MTIYFQLTKNHEVFTQIPNYHCLSKNIVTIFVNHFIPQLIHYKKICLLYPFLAIFFYLDNLLSHFKINSKNYLKVSSIEALELIKEKHEASFDTRFWQ